jgi:NTE family protein
LSELTRKKVGLALSGGGARGFAHVGVLKVLVENDIPIDMIAGTSAGSIVGAALAAGMSIDEMLAMAAKVGYTNMMLPSVAMGGVFTNAPMGSFLATHLPVTRFEDLKLPFAAIAYELSSEKVVIRKDRGDLITAIRASCAVPGVFAPVLDELGRTLVDGGVVSPLPVDAVRGMGADIVIGVDLMACGASFRQDPRTSVGIMIRSALALLKVAAAHEAGHAEIVIEPAIAHLRPDQIGKRDEFIALGESAAQARIDEIKKLLGD